MSYAVSVGQRPAIRNPQSPAALWAALEYLCLDANATKTANNFHNSFLPECNNFCTL